MSDEPERHSGDDGRGRCDARIQIETGDSGASNIARFDALSYDCHTVVGSSGAASDEKADSFLVHV